MEKRFFVALFFSLIAIAVSQLLFPPAKPNPSSQGTVGADSVSGLKNTASSTQQLDTQSTGARTAAAVSSQGRAADTSLANSKAGSVAETTAITTPKAIYKFSNVGAAPISIVIRDYKNRSASGGIVDLGVPSSPLLSYQLVTPTDTGDLAQVPFTLVRARNTKGDETLTYSASVKNLGVSISYTVSQDTAASYALRVDGRIVG